MPAKKTSYTLSSPPSLIKTIGPSFILLGLALGSGELLLWPYLTANYGLGLVWGALLGISFQYIMNTEVIRYSLARGESIFVGFRQLSILIPMWFIISTFIPWSLPGFSSATAQVLSQFIPGIPPTAFSIALLLLVGVILTLGKTLYRTMVKLQLTNVLIGIPFIAILVILLTTQLDWTEAAQGLVGKGNGWWFFPPGVALTAFLGAFAYSGAGGNLGLAQTYYIKEKGLGMGKGTAKISSLLQQKSVKTVLDGHLFSVNATNKERWKAWWRLACTEHFIVFWLLGIITILMLAVLAKSLVFGQADAQGIQFLYQEAEAIRQRTLPIVGTIFLLLASGML